MIQVKQLVRCFDKSLTRRIMELPAWLRSALAHASILAGTSVVYGGAICAVLIGAFGGAGFYSVGLMIMFVAGSNSLLKLAVRRQRPLTYAASGPYRTYSFPSGHMAGGTAVYGGIGYITLLYGGISILSLSFLTLLLLVIVSIGLSRVYVGAHFPSDVVAGWIFGASASLVCLLFAF